MKKFISTFVLIIVIIGLVIALGYTGKAIISKDNKIASLNQEVDDLKGTIVTLNNTIERMQDSDDTITEEPKKEIVEKDENISYFFDEKNIINKEENTSVTEELFDSMDVLDVSVNTQMNALVISLKKNLAKLIYGYNGDGENHTVTGFAQKIVDVKVAMVGTSSKDIKVVLLMSDGTIKYIDIDSILDESYTVKTIEDEKDYIKLVKVVVKETEKTSAKYGIVGISNDGTCKVIEF